MERLAFCKLLHAANGGAFTSLGIPIPAPGVISTCDRAFDCLSCPLMGSWLAHLESEGWVWSWECDACLKATKDSDRLSGVQRELQGFYQAGRKNRHPDDPMADEDRPVLDGCQRCGWETSFLQLVIRRTS